MSLHVPAGACIPVASVSLYFQFMYFQYNVYLSIVVCTNIYKYIHTQNNLRTSQLAGFTHQLGYKNIVELHLIGIQLIRIIIIEQVGEKHFSKTLLPEILINWILIK